MSSLRSFFFQLTHASPERKASRSQLKQAKAGNSEAYLALVANYLDLALVYFGSSLRESSKTRCARVEQIFTALWRHLPYAERVSDYEYMLASALLENAPDGGTQHPPKTLITKLRQLPPRNRFAFIAYELEGWPLRWVSLLMRLRPRALHRLLSQARCELCGVRWQALSQEERNYLERISVCMDASPNVRVNKELSRHICHFPQVSEIKALWLELRPELVEIRYRYLLEPQEREALLGHILAAIQSTTMDQPALVDRVVNTVHFRRHIKIKVS